MLATNFFWDSDSSGAILRRNNGFLTRGNSKMRCAKARKWLDALVAHNGPLKTDIELVSEVPCEQSQRIFVLDSERTFVTQKARDQHIKTLCSIYQFTQDYHQGLGFIVAWMLLFFSPSEVVAVVHYLHSKPMNGYFKGKATNFYRDAMVLESLLHEHIPQVWQSLERSGVVAGTYASKWMVGLNLHILPFEHLFSFYGAFLASSSPSLYLFGFSLAVCDSTKSYTTNCNDVSKVLEYLRFDDKVISNDMAIENGEPGSFFVKVLSEAEVWCKKIDANKIERLRVEFGEILRLKEEKIANATLDESSDGISFSDETDD